MTPLLKLATDLVDAWPHVGQLNTAYRISLAVMIEKALREQYKAGMLRAAKEIPDSWLDPLLTGPSKVVPGTGVFNCKDLETLLNGIGSRIRAEAENGEWPIRGNE